MPASWSWILADRQGSNLCELATASGRSLSFKRNTYSEAQLTLSHEDDAAYPLLDAIANTGMPTLKCYRRLPSESTGTLRFNGYLAGLQEDAEEQSTLTATFRSPFGRLLGDGDKTGRFVDDRTYGPLGAFFTGADAGDIAEALLSGTNDNWGQSGLQVSPDPQPRTKARDRQYPVGTNIGQAIVNLTNVLDGFDFYELFIDGDQDILATFKVVGSLGVVQPTARFEYGPTTLSNVRAVTRNILPPENVVIATGANGLAGLYALDIEKYSGWWSRVDLPDVSEQATLDDKARANLRPNPVKTIQFMPEFGLENCPKPWDDFWLGDTVRFLARRGALYENTPVRVNGIKVVVDENGLETTEVEDPTMPEEDAYIRANLTAEVV